jgi:DNA-binding NarL/FixJ family response regulator
VNDTKRLRILIADDFKALRDVIRLYLERAGDMEVVGEALELEAAIEHARALQPDVIIVNDYLPPVDSAIAAQRFREQGITAALLSVSMSVEPDLIRRSFQHGIDGFMHKEEIDMFLEQAVRNVHRGERFLSPRAREADSPQTQT